MVVILAVETEQEELAMLVEGVEAVELLRDDGIINGESGEPRSSSLKSSFLMELLQVRESRNLLVNESLMDS